MRVDLFSRVLEGNFTGDKEDINYLIRQGYLRAAPLNDTSGRTLCVVKKPFTYLDIARTEDDVLYLIL